MRESLHSWIEASFWPKMVFEIDQDHRSYSREVAFGLTKGYEDRFLSDPVQILGVLYKKSSKKKEIRAAS